MFGIKRMRNEIDELKYKLILATEKCNSKIETLQCQVECSHPLEHREIISVPNWGIEWHEKCSICGLTMQQFSMGPDGEYRKTLREIELAEGKAKILKENLKTLKTEDK